MNNGHCPICNQYVPPNPHGEPISKYWKDQFSDNLRSREKRFVEVYCSADHSLRHYEENKNAI